MTTAQTIPEQWRDLPGYEGLYRVSDRGRFLSLRKRRIFIGCVDYHGYRRVVICDAGGKSRHIQVQVLVMAAFVGPRPEGMVTDHINAIKTDNRLENLRYITNAENILRGTGQSAINALRTHCPQGHAYTPDNTRIRRNGARGCRACDRWYQNTKRNPARRAAGRPRSPALQGVSP